MKNHLKISKIICYLIVGRTWGISNSISWNDRGTSVGFRRRESNFPEAVLVIVKLIAWKDEGLSATAARNAYVVNQEIEYFSLQAHSTFPRTTLTTIRETTFHLNDP